jgi:hypothetical protein
MPNLHTYFNISVSSKEKRCFIYDPDNRSAFFACSPVNTDVFIAKKLQVCLFYRPSSDEAQWTPSLNSFEYDMPLLKSNLQKAIRRKQTDIAVSTLIAMLTISPTEVFRRLSVIFIEDVCLMSSISIVVWLMMCDTDYILKKVDIFLLVNIVMSLCETDKYFADSDDIKEYAGGHREICDQDDAILAVYYRSKYGGLKGDMAMLRRAITYYLEGGDVIETKWTQIVRFHHKVLIIPEAIDFHPYPKLLWDITKVTRVPRDVVKMTIWNVESGLNVRKPETILRAKCARDTNEWLNIKPVLDNWRSRLCDDIKRTQMCSTRILVNY